MHIQVDRFFILFFLFFVSRVSFKTAEPISEFLLFIGAS